MANVIIPYRFWVRRDTAANWTSVNPVPSDGEWCLETDTRLIKMGDGVTAWVDLDYFDSGSSSAVPYFIPDGDDYTVAINKQALFTLPIDLGQDSALLIDGILVEVD